MLLMSKNAHSVNDLNLAIVSNVKCLVKGLMYEITRCLEEKQLDEGSESDLRTMQGLIHSYKNNDKSCNHLLLQTVPYSMLVRFIYIQGVH